MNVMVKIYLVRHCQTLGNVNRMFQGCTDTEPSEEGLKQLELLALRFRNVHLDKIYSSNLGRAVKTAQSINKYHNIEHIELEGIREINVGKIDGMDWEKIPEKYPEFAKLWNDQPQDFISDGGETMREVFNRVSRTFDEIVSENEGKTVAIVSHGCALRNLMCYCLNKPIEELNSVDFGSNTAVSLVEVEDGVRRVVIQNDVSHIPGDHSKPHSARFTIK